MKSKLIENGNPSALDYALFFGGLITGPIGKIATITVGIEL